MDSRSPASAEITSCTTADLGPARQGAIRELLDDAFAGEFAEADWENACGGRHIVVIAGSDVIAHAAVVPRVLEIGGRPFRTGYVEAVATAPEHQDEGFGSLAMRSAARIVRRDHELGALSTGRHAFYERLGWERWRGPTFVRDGAALTRTEDEDDGVMVLRFGPSATIDVTAPITCDPRPGDDW
jgi:aminoglycoside 2'-N-acetyltransferase I